MMFKNFYVYSIKKTATILFILVILVFGGFFTVSTFADTSPLIERQNTLTNQERKLEKIQKVKDRLKKETDPTAQAALLLRLKSEEDDATREAIAETLIPTDYVIIENMIATSTEKARNGLMDPSPQVATPFGAETKDKKTTEQVRIPNKSKTPHILSPGEAGLMNASPFFDLSKIPGENQ